MSIPTIGSFSSPYDLDDPNCTIVYMLDLAKTVDGVEQYTGTVGAGSIHNNYATFDTAVEIAFSWNPATKECIVGLGNFRWIRIPNEYEAIPKNLTDYRFGSTDSDESIICFNHKRYDFYVSVSRTMNEILQNPDCTIYIIKFTDEERKEYDADKINRLHRNYLRKCATIAWPDILDPLARMAWLKDQDPETYDLLKNQRHFIERECIYEIMNANVPLGSCYSSLDGHVHGPFSCEKQLIDHMMNVVPQYHPAAPIKATLNENGLWQLSDIE